MTTLAGGMVLWPFGCASTGPSPGSASAPAADGPTQLIAAGPRSPSILPHPALALAKGTDGSVSVSDIAERAAPSVVNVASSKVVPVTRRAPFLDDPFFRHFFGPGGPDQPEPGDREQKGMGSGVIVGKDGLVLTNSHVVEGAGEIRVTTSDEREFHAKVLGSDEKSDLAVLRLEGDTSSLVPLEFGDSSRLRLGDVVLAIGNPFGVGQTITMGIVSAKGRANMGIVDYEDFIQTDAAINPGNSGGALVDMEGRLVGINTAILSRTGGYMGIGFAIPSNMAQPIMQSLAAHGKVTRGYLGAGIQTVDRELAKALGLPDAHGVLVSEVMKDGPGGRAGLMERDVIVSVDGKPTQTASQLRNAVAAAGAGKQVKLSILREGKPVELRVSLSQLPEEEGTAPHASSKRPSSASEKASPGGLTVRNLDDVSRQRFEVPGSVRGGALVTGVTPGSPAAKAGLRPGDVVLEVGKQAVDSAATLERTWRKSGERVLVRISRGGRSLYVVVKR